MIIIIISRMFWRLQLLSSYNRKPWEICFSFFLLLSLQIIITISDNEEEHCWYNYHHRPLIRFHVIRISKSSQVNNNVKRSMKGEIIG